MKRLMVLLAVLTAAAAGVAAYALTVEEVRVRGATSIPSREIVEASGLEPGDRMLLVRMSAAERRVERLPGVAGAVAVRSFPGMVVIRVRERVAVARLDAAEGLVVDEHGVVFAARGNVPVELLHGWSGDGREGTPIDRVSRAVLSAYPNFPDVLRQRTRRIVVDPAVVLVLDDETEIRFGRPRDLLEKAASAGAVLAAEAGTRLAYVDVRSPKVPVSRAWTPPEPEPTPAPPAARPTPTPTPSPTPVPPPEEAPQTAGEPAAAAETE